MYFKFVATLVASWDATCIALATPVGEPGAEAREASASRGGLGDLPFKFEFEVDLSFWQSFFLTHFTFVTTLDAKVSLWLRPWASPEGRSAFLI